MSTASNNPFSVSGMPASAAMSVRPALRGLRAYSRPAHQPWVDLRLDANEGTPPPADVLDWNAMISGPAVERYPSTANLEAQIADRYGVEPDRVLVTAGGDDAIDRACRARLGPGDEIIIPTPTFEMIARYARLAGAEVVTVPWRAAPYPCEAVLNQMTPSTAMIAVVSPNNPTGLSASGTDLERLAAAAPRAMILADLAYAEFADHDLTSVALALDNAVAVRTFSKAWGLAGLRIGFAIGPAPFIAAMRAAGGPYPVSGLSIAAAAQLLDHGQTWLTSRVRDVRTQRQSLAATLRSLGINVSESDSNFILGRFRNADWVRAVMDSLGIAVRGYPGNHELSECLRISCPGGDGITQRIASSLLAALQPQAILLDMDGVLADVSNSYRRAILLTAGAMGARVTSEDIRRVRAGGDASNDWAVTHRLLRENGVDVAMDRIIDVFQGYYEGRDGARGLRENESLIPPRAVLTRLACRIPLAIVTGRPRREAMEFLIRQGVAKLFATVVCMEDAAPKPDPAPVRCALDRLGVGRAWLVGDTVDDLVAARRAGVVPIGIPAPGDLRDALVAQGPAVVLDSLAQLEDLLA